MRHRASAVELLLAAALLFGCSDPGEPPRVELEVVEDSSAITGIETNVGYTVELVEARMALADLMFTIAGEAHTASLWEQLSDLLVPNAHAHPGHYQGGEVTGELRGRFVVDWLDGDPVLLGRASLLVGSYQSANFTFVRAQMEDGLASNDALVGHTALLRGTATKDDVTTSFVAVIDSPDGRELVGAPCELEVTETSRERLGLRLLTLDPLSGATLFDDLHFAALDADGDGEVRIDEASTEPAVVDGYNLLRRTFQTHDHFDVHPTTAHP